MTELNFPASPTNGQVYNGYSWNSTISVWTRLNTAIDIDDLSNVEAPAPAVGQVLVYNGTEWVNQDSPGGYGKSLLLGGM